MLKFLRRILGLDRGAPARPASPPVPFDDVVKDIRHFVGVEVASGFTPADQIAEAALEIHADGRDDADTLRPYAERFVRETLQAHSLEQAAWTEPTDCDRLDSAFAALEAEGVISRQNFTCCGTCGAAEIHSEIDAAKAAGRPAKGYAFYHMQDTESAVEGYGLYLNYGACEDTSEAAVAVGHEIVSQLNQHGLQTEWDGSIERRIAVSLDWKRRRPNTSA